MITVESVTSGHPDKVADRISDAVLDHVLREDRFGRVACETMVTGREIVVAGEISFKGKIDIPTIVRDTVRELGYIDPKNGFWYGLPVRVLVTEQSSDISLGVDRDGAGDQGNMFGYATDESDNYMPKAINLVNSITMGLDRLKSEFAIGPDGKAQITMSGERVDSVVVSTQHSEEISSSELKEILIARLIDVEYGHLYINPTGRFVKGGPVADAGLTGRKIIIDSYGPFCRHGGGAFSGKDPTKVDRSGAYAARWIAKNIVAAKLAKRCEVQLGYVIGLSYPVSLYINSYGTGVVSDDELNMLVRRKFDLRPMAIIERLDLRRDIYSALSAYGHFGRAGCSWEELDMVADLQS